MKKLLLWITTFVLVVSVIATFSLAGCKEEEVVEEEEEVAEEVAEEEEPTEEGEIETEGLLYSVLQYPTKQEKEAILAARKIAQELGGQVTLKVVLSPDNVIDFEPFYPEWERETGIKLETITIPWPDWYKELLNVSITKTDKYDVLMIAPQWIPDLAEAKVLENLTPYIEKYKPEATDPNSPNRVLDGLASLQKYKDDYYTLLSDTDVSMIYLRKDLLEDPSNKAAFEAEYGYPLEKPKTIEEWKDQLEFFTNPEEGSYGMTAKWGDEALTDFYPRLLSKGITFFDDEMHPNINSPEAVEALQEMKDFLAYVLPGSLEFNSGRNMEAFATGKAYCTNALTWVQAAVENPEFSTIVGNVTYAPYPGRMINGELINPQSQFWGWGYSVSAYSKYKELAYLYGQWMNGAAMNARVGLTPGGWYDICKVSNYDETLFPEIRRKNGGVYMDEWLEVQEWQVENCFPPISIRGGSEYETVLSEAVSAVLNDVMEPQEALDDVAVKWEEITERYGREEQIESWNSLKSIYSPNVQKMLGIE